MKVYRIPPDAKAILFDIDSTLYTNAEYAKEQVDVQIRHFADLRGISHQKAREMVAEYRREWAQSHGGQKTSLGNTLAAFGVPISESVHWREELLEPAEFLRRDEKLAEALAALSARFSFAAVTNNPVLPARKTLRALGVEDFFACVVGLDTCGVSKPHRAPYELAAQKLGAQNGQCISVGDRYDIDLALPLQLGMGGILVRGVEDVYELPGLLLG